jgi:hypothetical protein
MIPFNDESVVFLLVILVVVLFGKKCKSILINSE